MITEQSEGAVQAHVEGYGLTMYCKDLQKSGAHTALSPHEQNMVVEMFSQRPKVQARHIVAELEKQNNATQSSSLTQKNRKKLIVKALRNLKKKKGTATGGVHCG